ncbi:MAG: hypothetical protein FWF02_11280 [Micrococcales bacterium]|nr:hypothetical protein [Micrococcales bacterium]MCL2668270.1 hypothetical protein [Micrococcales bacterium]
MSAARGQAGRARTSRLLFRLPAVLTVLVVAVVVPALAYWAAGTSFAGGTVTAGDLQVVVGEATWQQVTPGVTSGAGGVLGDDHEFWSMPGDVVVIEVPVTTVLHGSRLTADMTVEPAALTGDVVAGFHVRDADGHQVAPADGDAPVGTALTIGGLVGGDDPVTTGWSVVVRVEVHGDYQWGTPASPGSWSPGHVRVQLDQTRAGGA